MIGRFAVPAKREKRIGGRTPQIKQWEERMKTRVAVMSIIVDEKDSVEVLNAVLHEFGDHIIGRMGIPYRQRGIHIISIALDAPQDTISSLAGRLGNIPGLSVKTAYSNVVSDE